MIDRSIVDPDEVRRTINDWILEEGSMAEVARRMGIHQSAISKAHDGKMKMTASRWEKWKLLWQFSYSYEECDGDVDNAVQYAKILVKNELILRGINLELNKVGYKIVITKKDSGQ